MNFLTVASSLAFIVSCAGASLCANYRAYDPHNFPKPAYTVVSYQAFRDEENEVRAAIAEKAKAPASSAYIQKYHTCFRRSKSWRHPLYKYIFIYERSGEGLPRRITELRSLSIKERALVYLKIALAYEFLNGLGIILRKVQLEDICFRDDSWNDLFIQNYMESSVITSPKEALHPASFLKSPISNYWDVLYLLLSLEYFHITLVRDMKSFWAHYLALKMGRRFTLHGFERLRPNTSLYRSLLRSYRQHSAQHFDYKELITKLSTLARFNLAPLVRDSLAKKPYPMKFAPKRIAAPQRKTIN